jgi:hypothetical protein
MVIHQKELLRMRLLTFVMAGLLASSAAQAATLTLGTLTGSWDQLSVLADDPTKATVTVDNQDGQAVDTIRWGIPSDGIPANSAYTFDPFNGFLDPDIGVAFVLGEFAHINNTIRQATSLFTGVEYDFSLGTNGDPGVLNDTITFVHNETPNQGSCPVGTNPCADIVTITVLALTTQIIVGGDVYLFELLGFSNDGGATFTNQFVSGEGQTNVGQLYAIITADVADVPEPTSLALLGIGMFGLAASYARRRRRNTSV